MPPLNKNPIHRSQLQIVEDVVRYTIWTHRETRKFYVVMGFAWNTITDCWDVIYEPYDRRKRGPKLSLPSKSPTTFTRQIEGHPKSWKKRFIQVPDEEIIAKKKLSRSKVKSRKKQKQPGAHPPTCECGSCW